jgi:ArsR family transcriptional regulator, arsenate/arsenite/antimonite-responsive transcriptional repressor
VISADSDISPGDLLRVLADPLRERIVRLLAREALCNCHLVEETGASQTNVSNHLRQLRRAGVVTTEPHGRYTYYRLRPDALRTLAAALTDLADTAETNAETRRPCP